MVQAARNLVAVHVDTDKNPALAQQFGLRTIPAIFFLDSEGRPIERYRGRRDAEALRAKIEEIARKHSRSFDSLKLALEAGKESKKPVVQVILDGREASKGLVADLRSDAMKGVVAKVLFVWTRAEKDAPAPVVSVFDPRDGKVLAKLEGRTGGDELKAKLEEAIRALEE